MFHNVMLCNSIKEVIIQWRNINPFMKLAQVPGSRTTCEAHNTCVLLSEEWLILKTLISSNLPIIHYSLILIRVREKKYVPELFLEETVTFTKLLSNCKCRNITFKHFENIVQNNAANRYLCHMSILSNRGKF